METAIQEIERKMKILQKHVDNTKEGAQKTLLQNSLRNAAQMLANFYEIERLLANRKGDSEQ